jgi:OFA family oxalate/formate antiporter-like MFS transporter
MKANKNTTLLGSIIIMICMGGIYAWSIFVPELIKEYGLSSAQTQFIFGFTIAVFTISMIFAGRIEHKLGPRKTALLGSFFFVLGNLIASFSSGNFITLLLGISIFTGIGIGLCYLTCLVTPVKWFPKKKGLITGVSVAGFGLGAVFLTLIVDYFLGKEILILDILLIVTILYGIILVVASFLLVEKDLPEKNSHHTKTLHLLQSRQFWALSIGIFAGTFAGLLLLGNLKPLGTWSNLDESLATLSISIFAIGSMIGRVFWGYLSDRISEKKVITLGLLFLAFSCLALAFSKIHPLLFLVNTFALGIGFGANFVVFVKGVSDIYGIEKVGRIYPYVFLFYGIAGVLGPVIGGRLYDIFDSYYFSIFAATGVCLLGIIIFNILFKEKHIIVENS